MGSAPGFREWWTNWSRRPRARRSCCLGKGVLKQEERKSLPAILQKVQMELTSNAPFLVDCFTEAVEKVAKASKAEVDAFIANVVTQAGLSQLRAQGFLPTEGQDRPLLPEPTDR